jgi:magnesium transporter
MKTKTHKPPVGASPGTLAVHPGALQSVIHVFAYDETKLEESADAGIAEVQALQASGRKLWVDVQGLGDEKLMRQLGDLFSMHPLALEDVVHATVRPKAEAYDQNLLVVTRMLRIANGKDLDVEQVSLVVGKDYVLTFQQRYGDVLDPVRQRLRVDNSRIRMMPSEYLAYAILDTIVDSYRPVLEVMDEKIDILEDLVLTEPTPETLEKLSDVRSQLLTLKHTLAPQREAIGALTRGENELMSKSVRVYLRDTSDHIVQAAEVVDNAREMVGGLMNTYLTVVNNRMNEVMKTLTIVASLFIPLTFLAGIYGMNFQYMPELAKPWAYPTVLIVMAIVAGLMVVYFWRKGWLRRD